MGEGGFLSLKFCLCFVVFDNDEGDNIFDTL